jgi:parallel beta-helix repeat protein
MLKYISVIMAMNAVTALAGTIYVNSSLGSDAWDGRCEVWDGHSCGPKATIQAGIDAADAGDEVLIADGTYRGAGNKELDFGGKAVTLRSGTGNPTACVIDCNRDGGAFYFHSGEDAASIVRDLTVRGANSDTGAVYCYNSSPSLVNCTFTGGTSNNGGGVFCEDNSSPLLIDCTVSNNLANCGGGVACSLNSSPMLANCTVRDNRAAYGAGVWCSQSSNPILTDCLVTGNTNGDFGAGVDCYNSSPVLINCTISENCTLYGGGAMHFDGSTGTVIHCSILNNIGGDTAGGIYCIYDANPTFIDCIIAGNTCTNRGGGIFCHYATATLTNCTLAGNSAAFGGGLECLPSSSPTLTNCTIMGNMASACGGGLHCYESSPILTNCLISDNSAVDSGGGLYSEYHANPVLTNCTITHNTADIGGGLTCTLDSSPLLTNCILWADSPTEICLESGSPAIAYTDLQDGWIGLGNIDADPLFRDPDGPDGDPGTYADNDYRLSSGSPCVDAGEPDFAPGPHTTDLDGCKRLWDGDGDSLLRVDMGAFEYGAFRFGDLNCDGSLNGYDIDPLVLALTDAAAYAQQYPACDRMLADVNGDGAVNGYDIDPFVLLLAAG